MAYNRGRGTVLGWDQPRRGAVGIPLPLTSQVGGGKQLGAERDGKTWVAYTDPNGWRAPDPNGWRAPEGKRAVAVLVEVVETALIEAMVADIDMSGGGK